MRVCVITTSFPRSSQDSAGIFIAHTVDALGTDEIAGVVIAPGEIDALPVEARGRFTIERCAYLGGTLAYGSGMLPNCKRNPFRLLQLPFMLFAMLKAALQAARTCDVIHAHWLISGMVAYCVSMVTKKPYIVSVRGDDRKLLRIWGIRSVFAHLLRKSAAIHVVSKNLYEEVGQVVAANKVNLIFNGIHAQHPDISTQSRQETLTSLNLPQESNFLLYVGRRIESKGVARLFPLLKLRTFRAHYLICVGPSESAFDERLMQQAQAAGVADRVKFLPAIPHAEVSRLMAHADYVVSGSLSEGRPNVLLEALSVGTECLASDIAAHRELAEVCDSVTLFPDSYDISQYETFVAKLETSDRNCNSCKAREYAQNFTWAKTALAMKKLYTDILRHS